jgi:hypothetical protein
VAPNLAYGTIGVPTLTDRRTPEGATVSTQSILDGIACVTANLLPSQSLTLTTLVAAAIRVERPNLATLGRQLAGPTTAKTAIKRVWRFTDNRHIEVADVMRGVIAKLVRRRKKRKTGQHVVATTRNEPASGRIHHPIIRAIMSQNCQISILIAIFRAWSRPGSVEQRPAAR